MKTISWRVVGTIDTMLLAWLITGDITIGMAIGGVETVSKLILYFVHERVWDKLHKRNQRKALIDIMRADEDAQLYSDQEKV